jgi:dUTP pyrophosphatase
MGGFLAGLLVGAPIGMGIGIAAIALCMAGKDGDMDELKVMLDEGAFLPERAHATDAGADLRTPVDIEIPAKGSAVVDTGVHIALPPNTVGMLKSKSGLNVKHGIVSEGVIDEGYTGSIVAKLYNHGGENVHLARGTKVTQLVVMPVEYVGFEQVDEISGGERGDAGFGSTDDI